jgi:hypothetical protein
MVIYELICGHGHKFEGWFPGQDAFQIQHEKGLLTCQVCGDTHVSKVLSGGHFMKTGPTVAEPKSSAEVVATGEIDGAMVLKALKYYVKTHFENVGKDFAATALKMKEGEIPMKNICGEATAEEREKLTEEDIPHLVLPDLPPEFEN